jgi:hypothetical protein
LLARKLTLRHRTRDWSVLLSPVLALANILGVLGIKSLEIEVTHTFPFSKFSDAYQFTEKDGFIGKAGTET